MDRNTPQKYEIVYIVRVGGQDYEFTNRPAAKSWAYEKLGDDRLYRKIRRAV